MSHVPRNLHQVHNEQFESPVDDQAKHDQHEWFAWITFCLRRRWSILRSRFFSVCIHINRSMVFFAAGRVGTVAIVKVISLFGTICSFVTAVMVCSNSGIVRSREFHFSGAPFRATYCINLRQIGIGCMRKLFTWVQCGAYSMPKGLF